ncbi:MAG TPA: IS66 family transposase [Granulicella sp.]|jgi:transposase
MDGARAVVADLTTLDRTVLEALVLAQQEKLLSRDSEIEHLKLVIAKLRRMMFGTKSEKVTREIEQLELKLEELETRQAERARTIPTVTDAKNKPTRRPLPEHLPCEVHTHLPLEDACSQCGGELRKLGEDVSEMLEYVPASFKVLRHVRPKLSCTKCDVIVEAPTPSRPIERGLAGPGLLAHVLVSKYADHCPLYRQSEIYARAGVDLDRSTLADWVGATSHLLTPLVDKVRDHVLAASKLHADDTPVPVLAPGMGKTKTARLWTYVRDDRPAAENTPPAVWFAYSEDRRGEHPKQHLSRFSGILQADGYAGFHHLYEGGRIVEAACWAHVRRKFYDIHVANGSAIAAEAIERIGLLYVIEREIRGRSVDIRLEIRQARARPLIDDLHRWLNKTLAGLSRKSDTAVAIRYALSRWRALTRYLDNGRIELDNSAAERALRAVALGRKNYLFAGSDAGGERAAAIYTLLGTAKLNGLDPELYLRHVLERIADHPINRIHELLPWNLAVPTLLT